MEADYEKRLEAEISRELNSLPPLRAPATLAERVMTALNRRSILPWYKQSWQAWPVPAQAVSFVFLAAFFTALVFGVWKLPETTVFALATRKLAGWCSAPATLWNAANSMVGLLVVLVKGLGNGFLLGALAALGLAWAMCLGVGTACARMAFARR